MPLVKRNRPRPTSTQQLPKKIAIFTSAEGHVSIAEAIYQELRRTHQLFLFKERDDLFDYYVPLYQYFPMGHKLSYALSRTKQATSWLTTLFERRYKEMLTDFYDEYKPDLCISSHFIFNPILEQLHESDGVPFINVLSDPRTIHPLLISETANVNAAFDAQAVQTAAELSPDAHVKPWGWFVREQFEQPYSQKRVRSQLGLQPDMFTLLVASGSEGTTMIMKILPALIDTAIPIQVVIACGNNTLLYKAILALQTVVNGMSQNVLVPLRFTKKIHQYMQAADLVIGKAGPNTIFESIATRTPFFAITHIAGQEDGNLDIITERKLGFVEENPLRAVRLLNEIIAQPEQLNRLRGPIEKMALYNQRAKEKLCAAVEKLA